MFDVRDRILRLKKVCSIIAVILFIFGVVFCSLAAKDLKLSEISLSTFGIDSKIGFVWNITLFLIGIFLYVDALRCVFMYFISDIINKRLIVSFTISTVFLLLTALIDMTHKFHNFTAGAYFIGYTVSIFLFGFKLLKSDFRIGMTSVVISICSAVVPILLTFFIKGLAISEIAHTIFIFMWVISLSFETEYKRLLKFIGL